MQEFLARLANSKEIRTRRYDDRTVDDTKVNAEDFSKETKPRGKRRTLWEKPPRIEIVLGDPIPDHNLEILKGLIKKERLRRQRTLPEENALAQNQAPLSTKVYKPQRHVIHKAIEWKKLLENGTFKSRSEIAKKEGLTRARVTQIMNLLRLPPRWRDFLKQLDDPKEIRKYSERRFRSYDPDKYLCTLCPIKEPVDDTTV